MRETLLLVLLTAIAGACGQARAQQATSTATYRPVERLLPYAHTISPHEGETRERLGTVRYSRPLAPLLIAAAAALSPIAVASAQEAAAQPAFEGEFTQTEQLIQSGGAASDVATIRQVTRITGSLVWSPEEASEQNLPHLPSFGAV